MSTGKVKFFNPKKFYGFIVAGDRDFFFHGNDFIGDPEYLEEGQKVEFESEEDKKNMLCCPV